jgi:hypothetical protein
MVPRRVGKSMLAASVIVIPGERGLRNVDKFSSCNQVNESRARASDRTDRARRTRAHTRGVDGTGAAAVILNSARCRKGPVHLGHLGHLSKRVISKIGLKVGIV